MPDIRFAKTVLSHFLATFRVQSWPHLLRFVRMFDRLNTLEFNGIIRTVANFVKQKQTRKAKNFGSEGWGFESLKARVV